MDRSGRELKFECPYGIKAAPGAEDSGGSVVVDFSKEFAWAFQEPEIWGSVGKLYNYAVNDKEDNGATLDISVQTLRSQLNFGTPLKTQNKGNHQKVKTFQLDLSEQLKSHKFQNINPSIVSEILIQAE